MAKTKLSDLGSKVAVGPDQNEHIIPALGNGAGVPGDLCYRIHTTGKIAGSTIGALEFFEGILKESPITGTETAIVDGVKCSLIVPTPGHRYRIRIIDQNANKETGQPITFSTTAFKATAGATLILGFIGRLHLAYVDDDTICDIVWD